MTNTVKFDQSNQPSDNNTYVWESNNTDYKMSIRGFKKLLKIKFELIVVIILMDVLNYCN